MKKEIAAVSAFAMAAVMCVGFAACGGSGSEAENIVSDKVTKAEWEAAFAEENFGNCKMEYHFTYGGVTPSGESVIGQDSYTTTIQDGKKSYSKTKSVFHGKTEEHEIYYADGNKYTVTEDGVKVETAESVTSVYNTVKGTLYFKDYYEYFEYSEKAKGYVYSGGASDTLVVVLKYSTLKFQNGKLVVFISSETEEIFGGGTETVRYEWVFTYGGQTVTLPQV